MRSDDSTPSVRAPAFAHGTGLLRRAIRELKYKTMDDLIGKSCDIQTIEDAEASIFSIVKAAKLDLKIPSIDLKNAAGTIKKYGLLDVECVLNSNALLDKEFCDGVKLLEELAFVASSEDLAELDVEDINNTYFLRKISEDLAKNTCFLKLFLERDKHNEKRFTIVDACLTNASIVWFNKHFYM
jgi:hypothetical protein